MFNFNFVVTPISIGDRMDKELSGNYYKIMNVILKRIMRFQDSRETLTAEFSCRYLSERTGLNYSYISKIIKKLSSLNFIKIIKSGCGSCGSIIKLIIPAGNETLSCHKETPAVSHVKQSKESINIKETCTDLFDMKIFNIGKKIVSERGLKDADELVSSVITYIRSKKDSIENIAGYFIGACKKITRKVLFPAGKKSEKSIVKVNNDKHLEQIKQYEANNKEADAEKSVIENYIQKAKELEESNPELYKTLYKKAETSVGSKLWKFTEASIQAQMILNLL